MLARLGMISMSPTVYNIVPSTEHQHLDGQTEGGKNGLGEGKRKDGVASIHVFIR